MPTQVEPINLFKKKIAVALTAIVRISLFLYRRVPISTSIRERVSVLAAQIAPEAYRRLVAIGDPDPVKKGLPNNDRVHRLADVLHISEFRLGFWKITHTLSDHVSHHGPITHVIAVPFFTRGGAEAAALNFCQAVIGASDCSVLLVATENRLMNNPRFDSPGQVLEIDLSDYFPGADAEQRIALLLGLIRLAGPDVFHIINSGVGWNLLIEWPDLMRSTSKLYASIFAFQFDPKTGQRIGYAADFLPAAIPHLDGLISDNHRFISDVKNEYGLSDYAARMHVAYNPVRNMSDISYDDSLSRISSIPERIGRAHRLQVVWAGRLDAEKKIELIPAIARLCPQIDFHLHGSRVVDDSRRKLPRFPTNVKLHGAFKEVSEIVARHDAHAFIFTSRWEGLPNVLLEFGALGIPIVAPIVGGVGELINDSTGYPLDEQATPEDYAGALRQIADNPDAARMRASTLHKLIEERHSVENFTRMLRSIPGYLPSGESL